MQDLSHWILQIVREEKIHWLEERKSEWTNILRNVLRHILEGKSVILVCDHLCRWFGQYVSCRINAHSDRPFVPVFCIESLFSNLSSLKKEDDLPLLDDLLSIAFKGQYVFWYVGCYDDILCNLALRNDESFLWILNKEIQNSFTLSSVDRNLDFKLLQLFRVFNQSLSATLFNEINLES